LYDEGEDEKKQVRDQSEQFISADSFILIIIYKFAFKENVDVIRNGNPINIC